MKSAAAIAAIPMLLLAVCAGVHAQERLRVFVSILPQKTFVERIGGERVDVSVLVQPGQSPATYEPTARQMARLNEAALYLRIGVPFENSFLPKLQRAVPGLRIVDTRNGVRLRTMADHGHGDHDHGENSGEGNDPHIWLSPRLAMVQATTIYTALTRSSPEDEPTFRAGLKGFLADLADLHADLLVLTEPVRGKGFMVFHPSWGYFADEYGLRQHAVEVDGKAPAPRQLTALIREAREQGTTALFVQPQFDRRTAERIAEAINGSVQSLDPLAEDYIQNLRTSAQRIREALRGEE
jgi:zinc transport system substrate-binding protein